MPVLPNARHERFAQELASGKSQTDAYEAAGYSGDRTAASHLATKINIQARVAELQSTGAERAAVTVESLIDEAEEARRLAMANGQPAAAVAAIREKGVLSGKRIERSEQGRPGEFEQMSDDELEAFIAGRESLAGESAGRERAPDRQKGMRGKSSGVH